ncbi:MAG: hypothetical protein Q4A21_01090 [bacterium]|nr:hypothetical protein [bacterium]
MKKYFISGSRSIKTLPSQITDILNKIVDENGSILVSDAKGVDLSIQKFFLEKSYPKNKISIYTSEQGGARHNEGYSLGWPTVKITPPSHEKDKFKIQRYKDTQMAEDCTEAIMLWEPTYMMTRFKKQALSKGTLYNAIEVLKRQKKVTIFFSPNEKLYNFSDLKAFEVFLKDVVKNERALKILTEEVSNLPQQSLF